jgi:hypothetical protein
VSVRARSSIQLLPCCRPNEHPQHAVRVEVYATGGGPAHRLLWSHTIRYGEPVPVELDVHGVIRLAFELSFLSGTKQFAGCEEAHPVLGSARLLVA